MPWKETCPMDERLKFIADYLKDEWNLSDLCQYYGISRKSGYKWLARYLADGPSGLHDRSRAPNHHPNAVHKMIQERIVAFAQVGTPPEATGARHPLAGDQHGGRDPQAAWFDGAPPP